MKFLLIVAHGSRRETSNNEVRSLAKAISRQVNGSRFDRVEAAFLEIAEPSIPDGLRQCIEQGASEIVVFPYFLAAGRHVVEDIPAEVQKVSGEFPGVKINVNTHLGNSSNMPQLIIDCID